MRILILLFLLVNTAVFAQEQRGPRVLFKIAPLALIDPQCLPTVQGGVEVTIAPKFSWYNEFGIRYRKGGYEKFDTIHVATSGFKIKSEVRYYFKDRKDERYNRLRGHYVGINYFYIKHKYNSDFQYYYLKDSTRLTDDSYGVTKAVWGINLVIGWQADMSKRLIVEFYGGLGARFRDIETVDQEFVYERDEIVRPRHPYVIKSKYERLEAKRGKSGAFNFTLGLRFAFKLF